MRDKIQLELYIEHDENGLVIRLSPDSPVKIVSPYAEAILLLIAEASESSPQQAADAAES